MKSYGAFAIALAACAAATPVLAVTPVATTKFTFSGSCSDCADTGTGTLTLQNYTLGDDLNVGNFVEWTYTSNLVTFDITAVSYLSGSLKNLPGPAEVIFGTTSSGLFDKQFFFNSSAAYGSWNTGLRYIDDFGPQHLWSLASAPELATWALMVAGFGMVGAMVRRRKVAASFA